MHEVTSWQVVILAEQREIRRVVSSFDEALTTSDASAGTSANSYFMSALICDGKQSIALRCDVPECA